MTSEQWGRVDDDGTVYVRTAEGAATASPGDADVTAAPTTEPR